jgi:hypothetical protein
MQGMKREKNVEEIKSKDGVTLTSFEDIKQAIFSHYGGLYTESWQVDINIREQSLSYIPHLVQDGKNAELTR